MAIRRSCKADLQVRILSSAQTRTSGRAVLGTGLQSLSTGVRIPPGAQRMPWLSGKGPTLIWLVKRVRTSRTVLDGGDRKGLLRNRLAI